MFPEEPREGGEQLQEPGRRRDAQTGEGHIASRCQSQCLDAEC